MKGDSCFEFTGLCIEISTIFKYMNNKDILEAKCKNCDCREDLNYVCVTYIKINLLVHRIKNL